VVVGVIGAVAAVMAFFGLLTSLARGVAERRRELAIRLAIGATSGGAVRLMVFAGLRIVAIAVVVGLALAAAAGRALASVVYGISPYDPVTYATVAVAAVVIGLAACYLPARRASHIAPMELLKSE
jgi:ABC-type antimicrobial peptide transport system permease subunit